MPKFNGTGPMGQGPRTGRGMGPCGGEVGMFCPKCGGNIQSMKNISNKIEKYCKGLSITDLQERNDFLKEKIKHYEFLVAELEKILKFYHGENYKATLPYPKYPDSTGPCPPYTTVTYT